MELKSLTELNKLNKHDLLVYARKLNQFVNKKEYDCVYVKSKYTEICSQRDDLLTDNHKLTSESKTLRENYDNKCADYNSLLKDYNKIKRDKRNIVIIVLLGAIVLFSLL